MNAKIKARKMWRTHYDIGEAIVFPTRRKPSSWDKRPPQEPVFVIDGSDIPKLVAQMGKMIRHSIDCGDDGIYLSEDTARWVLADLGIKEEGKR